MAESLDFHNNAPAGESITADRCGHFRSTVFQTTQGGSACRLPRVGQHAARPGGELAAVRCSRGACFDNTAAHTTPRPTQSHDGRVSPSAPSA
jgi:hypothetical protein